MVRIILFIFNFVFILVGLAMLIAGIVAAVMVKDVVAVVGNSIMATPIVIIIVGVIIFIIAFFGCCGAYKENRCMVLTYAVILAVLLVIEIGCTIAAFVLRGKIENILRKDLHQAIEKQYNQTDVKKAVDFVQRKFQCCGVNSSADWKQTIPDSCCKKTKCDTKVSTNLFKHGCLDVMKDKLKSKILWVGGIALLVCFVELLGVLFSCCLARALDKAYEPV